MAPRALVFVGPSLAGTPREAPPGVVLYPPAAAGDVYLAARDGARVIGLVDGLFEDRASVWHKEILWALEGGVKVVGAASLGALRAVECSAFGMEGVGTIFQDYRTGLLEDDHAVALEHAPAELGYAPLSEPLVNVRATLAAAATEGIVECAQADDLVTHAEALFYKDINWDRLMHDAPHVGWPEPTVQAFEGWLPTGYVNVKLNDARLLIARVAQLAADPDRAEPDPDFTFHATRHWCRAVELFEARQPGLGDGGRAVIDELRLRPERFEAELVRAFARRKAGHLHPGAPDPRGLLDALRLERGLVRRTEFEEWLVHSEVDRARLSDALMREQSLGAALGEATATLLGDVLDTLRIDGRYEAMLHRAHDKERRLAGRADQGDEGRRAPQHLTALIEALCARLGLPPDALDADDLVGDLGLQDCAALQRLLQREEDYLACLAQDGAAAPAVDGASLTAWDHEA